MITTNIKQNTQGGIMIKGGDMDNKTIIDFIKMNLTQEDFNYGAEEYQETLTQIIQDEYFFKKYGEKKVYEIADFINSRKGLNLIKKIMKEVK